ncbi:MULTISPECIES: FtsX-like permease family protein [unclassified Microbacterium]|uniref:FtsX-like permease family protein n=1 Tax=unclassified Microbacterium TaxID=2609290 RepID=UPI0012F7CEF2|nr:FtsX-like permease family protein [Microbacterium sp. MAH-37]MVQ42325.1 FtsX-like permease family protein [Microbacterium sp. MAH-37]
MNVGVLRMLLRPAPGSLGVIAIPAVAFGIVTTLVLTVLGGAQSFWTWDDDYGFIYQGLAAIAVVLLVVPLMTLGGAAARLSARRRDERLSTLRLLGVTPAGVSFATVVESALIAAIGAIGGILLYFALTPLIGLIPFRGAPLGVLAVILPAWQILAVFGGVILLAVLSAVVGLRRVNISPLGVRMRADAPRLGAVRAVAVVLVVAAGFAAVKLLPMIAGAVYLIAGLAAVFGVVLAVLNLIGPWVLGVRARRQLRRAETPERMLSARMVLDAPKAAWRQVSGIAMASFMAVFAGTGVALMDVMGTDDARAQDLALVTDMRTGLIITLIGSFLMVAASVGVNQASAIADQRDLHASLHRLGVPMETVDAARTRAIMSPLMVTAIGSALCAAIMILPLLGITLIIAPLSLVTIAGVLAIGILTVWAATRVTRPLLAKSFALAA